MIVRVMWELKTAVVQYVPAVLFTQTLLYIVIEANLIPHDWKGDLSRSLYGIKQGDELFKEYMSSLLKAAGRIFVNRN